MGVNGMPVFTFDGNMATMVKIEKHGKTYCVYRLEKVVMTKMGPGFIFEEYPCESWSYKPYEDKDVSTRPVDFFEDVKRWQPSLIVHIP
jgi:hypothetical protein